MSWIDWIYVGLVFVGIFFVVTAAIGVLKLPDTYTRLHAVSKGTTFGFAFVLMGTALLIGNPSDVLKAALAVMFQFITSPITGHVIARIALKRGMRPVIDPQGTLYDEIEVTASVPKEAVANDT